MQDVAAKFDFNAILSRSAKEQYVSDVMEGYMEYVKVES